MLYAFCDSQFKILKGDANNETIDRSTASRARMYLITLIRGVTSTLNLMDPSAASWVPVRSKNNNHKNSTHTNKQANERKNDSTDLQSCK